MALKLEQQIGMRVRLARKAQNLTQEELATRIDKTVETVSNIERGKTLPGLLTLYELAQVLRVPLIELIEVKERQSSASLRRLEAEYRLRDLTAQLSDGGLDQVIGHAELVLRTDQKAKKAPPAGRAKGGAR